MTGGRQRLFQFFKYVVYALLTMNIYWFFVKEYAASAVQFAGGTPIAALIQGYSSTIDTTAWVILLLVFELETYVLEGPHRSPLGQRSLHTIRVLCYGVIVYAFYGYIATAIFVYDVSAIAAINNICALAGENWTYAIDLDKYAQITVENCASLSNGSEFSRFGELQAVVSSIGLRDIRYLAWVDVINSAIWLIIVVVLEIDVHLQESGKNTGQALKISGWVKLGAYSCLFLAATYWGLKGDFVNFWDAFLWLIAFFFIEMNLVERREELAQETTSGATAAQ